MKRINYFLLSALVFTACQGESDKNETDFTPEITKISTLFDDKKFPNTQHKELLAELNICHLENNDTFYEGVVPCSPQFFKFYNYNHKRNLEDAFLLQVRQGVSGYPFRRLLIFTRENGKLVLMNGIRGYLVEKRTTQNEIDDLVVALVDNIGGHYERYDVLISYKEGKFHYIEALGDLQGPFNTEELKKEATKQIGERIKEKELIF